MAWRDDYIATFLERDLAKLGIRIPATTMRRFWTMIAHHHGQTFNGAELARALGVSQPTVRRYLDALTDALVVRQLQPWFANTAKREVKSPKVYVRDTGLLHRLLRIGDRRDLLGHPKAGASWEGFVIEQILMLNVRDPSFWGTHAGAEIDLLVTVDGQRVGIEVKRTDQPRLTPSVRNALDDLELDRVIVVHAGRQRFPLAAGVDAIPARRAAHHRDHRRTVRAAATHIASQRRRTCSVSSRRRAAPLGLDDRTFDAQVRRRRRRHCRASSRIIST